MDPNHLARPQGVQCKQRCGDEPPQFSQPVRPRTQDQDRDPQAVQILLMGNLLVRSNQDFKRSSFGCRQQFPILQACQTGIACRLAFMVREVQS